MKHRLIEGVIVAAVALASYIYTINANGVSSLFMTYAFGWVLLGFGVKLIFARLLVAKLKKWVKTLHKGLWLSYMLNATLGSIIIGVIEIAGSYSEWVMVQLGIGLVSLVLYGLVSGLILWSQR